jgi:hypothetical protein
VRGPSGMSHVVIEQVYSTLMALDPDAKPYPELAVQRCATVRFAQIAAIIQ